MDAGLADEPVRGPSDAAVLAGGERLDRVADGSVPVRRLVYVSGTGHVGQVKLCQVLNQIIQAGHAPCFPSLLHACPQASREIRESLIAASAAMLKLKRLESDTEWDSACAKRFDVPVFASSADMIEYFREADAQK